MNQQTSAQPPESVVQALVGLFESSTTVAGGIRVEDLLSAASAVCGEACIAAAGEFDPEHHTFTPGAAVLSDRVNGIVFGDTTDWERVAESAFGMIRAGALANGYANAEFPPLADVVRAFVAGIAGPGTPWGFVPLSVPPANRPRIAPLRSAYELRGPVREVLATAGLAAREWPAVIALSVAAELARVREAIDHRVALTLVFETVNGMAKTAPMTDEAFRAATNEPPATP